MKNDIKCNYDKCRIRSVQDKTRLYSAQSNALNLEELSGLVLLGTQRWIETEWCIIQMICQKYLCSGSRILWFSMEQCKAEVFSDFATILTALDKFNDQTLNHLTVEDNLWDISVIMEYTERSFSQIIPDMIVIDNYNLCHESGSCAESVSVLSALKALSDKHSIPIILLTYMNNSPWRPQDEIFLSYLFKPEYHLFLDEQFFNTIFFFWGRADENLIRHAKIVRKNSHPANIILPPAGPLWPEYRTVT